MDSTVKKFGRKATNGILENTEGKTPNNKSLQGKCVCVCTQGNIFDNCIQVSVRLKWIDCKQSIRSFRLIF